MSTVPSPATTAALTAAGAQAAMSAELKAQQDREMALLAEEFRKLGSNTDFAAAGAAGKKSSTCALQ